MNSKRVFYIMLGLLILLGGLGIGGAVMGSKMLKKEADKLVSLKLDNRVLEEQQISLGQAKKDIEKYAELEQIAKTIVPQEKDQARTVREIINLAAAAGVPIASITFPSSSLGTAAPKAPVSTGTPGDTPTPASKPATPPVTQVKPVDGITGLYQLEISVASDSTNPVPYSRLISFLTALENNRRTSHVTSINVTPSAKNRSLVSFNLIVNAYIKP
jgi:hypothetical protein